MISRNAQDQHENGQSRRRLPDRPRLHTDVPEEESQIRDYMPFDNAQSSAQSRRRQRRRVAEAYQHLNISEGARLRYIDLGEEQLPPDETFRPILHRAAELAPSYVILQGAPPDEIVPPVWLMRASNPSQAYALLKDKAPIKLDHRGADWGRILFAVVYPRVCTKDSAKLTFKVPSASQFRLVAIKMLNKRAIRRHRDTGGGENPYKEIARMQEFGDDEHVLSCIEALEDDQYLFIVLPKGYEAASTLMDVIPWGSSRTMSADRIHELFVQVLRILLYLEERNICHRDLSPDNFLFLTPERLVAFDLALSHRIPLDEMGRRTKVEPLGPFGTRVCMAPELWRNRPFDGVATDLWAAVVILYGMCTNTIVYDRPEPADESFRFWILQRRLNNMDDNEHIVEQLFNESDHRLRHQAMAHLAIEPSIMQILTNVLVVDPRQRWSLAQVAESDFVIHGELGERLENGY